MADKLAEHASAAQPGSPREAMGGFYTMPTSWVVGSMFCTTLASLTALAVVATVKDADALSTVALALSVLAFVASLLVAIGQGAASSTQFQQTSAINAQTQEALAEVRFAIGESLVRRDSQFDRLLESVVPSALAQSLVDQPDVPTSIDLDALGEKLSRTVIAQLDQMSPGGNGGWSRASSRADLDSFLADRPEAVRTLHGLPVAMQVLLWRELADDLSRISLLSDAQLVEYLRERQRLLQEDSHG